MNYVTILLKGHVIKGWVIVRRITEGIELDSERRIESLEPEPESLITNGSGTDRLQHEDHSICTVVINVAKIHGEFDIERKIQIELIGVPQCTILPSHRRGHAETISTKRYCITI